jgi:hypothetical protein
MENKESQILSEIMDMMASIRSQLEMLDAKMAELQNTVGQGEAEAMPIDLDIDDLPETEEVAPVVEETVVVEDDLPFYDGLTDGPAVEEPVAEEPVVEVPVADEPVVEDDDDDLPIFADPEPVQEAVPAPQKPKTAVIDAMTDRQAWRTDMPGTAVKDIRSAISLNDRILFINNLFGQDPMKFQDALTKINQMASLEEVVEYVETEQPGWNLESDTVYRFMMAVRRKVR